MAFLIKFLCFKSVEMSSEKVSIAHSLNIRLVVVELSSDELSDLNMVCVDSQAVASESHVMWGKKKKTCQEEYDVTWNYYANWLQCNGLLEGS